MRLVLKYCLNSIINSTVSKIIARGVFDVSKNYQEIRAIKLLLSSWEPPGDDWFLLAVKKRPQNNWIESETEYFAEVSVRGHRKKITVQFNLCPEAWGSKLSEFTNFFSCTEESSSCPFK